MSESSSFLLPLVLQCKSMTERVAKGTDEEVQDCFTRDVPMTAERQFRHR